MTPGFPEALFEALAAELDAELHLETTISGPDPSDDPFADGRYDLGWVCSTSYIGLELEARSPSVKLVGVAWVPDDPDNEGLPVYFGDVVVAADSPARSLSDLRGSAIGCNDPVSLSGHHALRWAIDDLDPTSSDRFASLRFTGGHQQSLDQVVSGQLDAAVVDSVVRRGRSRVDANVAGLRVIERLGPWPVQPLVAHADLADEQMDAVRNAILDANNNLHIQHLMRDAALSHFVEVTPDHYDPVRARLSRF